MFLSIYCKRRSQQIQIWNHTVLRKIRKTQSFFHRSTMMMQTNTISVQGETPNRSNYELGAVLSQNHILVLQMSRVAIKNKRSNSREMKLHKFRSHQCYPLEALSNLQRCWMTLKSWEGSNKMAMMTQTTIVSMNNYKSKEESQMAQSSLKRTSLTEVCRVIRMKQ